MFPQPQRPPFKIHISVPYATVSPFDVKQPSASLRPFIMIILVLMWFLSVPMLHRLSSNQITVERGSTVILLNPNSLHRKSCCRFRWESSISGHQISADRLPPRATPHGSWTLDALLDKYLSIGKDHQVDCLRNTGKSAQTTIL